MAEFTRYIDLNRRYPRWDSKVEKRPQSCPAPFRLGLTLSYAQPDGIVASELLQVKVTPASLEFAPKRLERVRRVKDEHTKWVWKEKAAQDRLTNGIPKRL